MADNFELTSEYIQGYRAGYLAGRYEEVYEIVGTLMRRSKHLRRKQSQSNIKATLPKKGKA